MITAILQGTPVHVWVLLAALVLLGLWQGRDRRVVPARLLLLPLALVALGLWTNLPSWRAQPIGALAWLAAGAAGIAAGRRLPTRAGAAWNAATSTIHLPASRLPLVVILSVFALRYGAGVSAAIAPQLARSPGFVVAMALAGGTISGLLLGRTLQLLTLVPSRRGATMEAHASL